MLRNKKKKKKTNVIQFPVRKPLSSGDYSDEKISKNSIYVSKAEVAKMLISVAEPLLEDCETKEEINFTLIFANMAWNVSLIRDEERAEVIDAMSEDWITPDGKNDRENANHFINLLVKRKLELYPKIHMFIEDFKIKRFKKDLQISVKTKPAVVFE